MSARGREASNQPALSPLRQASYGGVAIAAPGTIDDLKQGENLP
jgi:hypothetical protein